MQIILKHFRYSRNSDDKLFTDDIITYIKEKTEYEGIIDVKLLPTIILKCGVGTRSANGNIRINGKQMKGFSNIVLLE